MARVNSKFHPFQLRGRTAVHGMKNLTRAERLELHNADELGRRAFALALIIEQLKRVVLFETPVDRGDKKAPWYQGEFATHVYLFAATYAVEFMRHVRTELIHFCQCACGSVFQKRTSILASARVKHRCGALGRVRQAACSGDAGAD